LCSITEHIITVLRHEIITQHNNGSIIAFEKLVVETSKVKHS